MATVRLLRVDSRLIHGQVITKWITFAKANRIAVVDDALAGDSFMAEIFAAAAPPNLGVEVLGVEGFMAAWNAGGFGSAALLMLVKDIDTVLRLYAAGFDHSRIQLGNLPNGPGRRAVSRSVFMTDDEIARMRGLGGRGVQIDLQIIPEDARGDFMAATA